jgi:hypothetical protein
MLVVFAILGSLIIFLFLYIRQKMATYESRLNLLTDTVQTIASLNRIDSNESDNESENESESESESESECECEEIELKNVEKEFNYDIRLEKEIELNVEKKFDNDIRLEKENDLKDVEIELNESKKIILLEPTITVSDDVVTSEYDGLTLKELKEKVIELGGPKLKNKKELLDFLKKK